MRNVLRPESGDVLLNSTGTGTIGRSVVLDHDGAFIVDGHVTVLRPKAEVADGRWLNALLRTSWVQSHLERFCYSGSTNQLELSRQPVKASVLPVPTVQEQREIAQILDILDTAIHETEAIIAKLKAVKQGLLHDLLTRGIDANGELRPPQTEAPHLYKQSPLGWIPKEWGVVTLRDAALPSRESFIDGDWIETPFITSEGIRLIQTGNIGIGEFLDKRDSRRFISEASFRVLNCKWVNAGDILICRLADPIGRACAVPEHVGPAITSVDCTIFRADTQNFLRGFVIAWMNADASLKRAQDNAAGSTRSRISRSNLGMLPIAKPSLHEQQLIARTLSSSAERIASEDENLSKLRETKAGLMDDLLTGRVRVTPLL